MPVIVDGQRWLPISLLLVLVLGTLKVQAGYSAFDNIDRFSLNIGRATSPQSNVFTPFFKRLQEIRLRFRNESEEGSIGNSKSEEETKDERASEAALQAFVEAIKDEMPITLDLPSKGYAVLQCVLNL